MGTFHRIIYTPWVNGIIRNTTKLLGPLLPENMKIHPSGLLKVSLKENGHFTLSTNQTSFLTRELFWKSASGFEYTELFITLIKRVNTFFDIGANIGYYSIMGATVNPELSVYAFEPSIGPLSYLWENVKLNHLEDRVKIEDVALSDIHGKIDFYELRNPKFPNIYNLSGEHNIGTKKERLSDKSTVASTTLDQYICSNDTDGPDLIKLDTEGAEALILKGAAETIEKYRPIIVCETLFDKIEGELEAIMKGHGYRFFNHGKDGLIEVNTILRTEDDGVRNCFFVPREKLELISDLRTE